VDDMDKMASFDQRLMGMVVRAELPARVTRNES
ncbi:MAG: hypothetical protein JWP64_426, partial [Pseudonocardia sp.]|nr:hypothetical protein [Pseudonocardia sp.]